MLAAPLLLLLLAPWLQLAATIWLLWVIARRQLKAHRMGPERIRRLRMLQRQRQERKRQRLVEIARKIEAAQRRSKAEARGKRPPR